LNYIQNDLDTAGEYVAGPATFFLLYIFTRTHGNFTKEEISYFSRQQYTNIFQLKAYMWGTQLLFLPSGALIKIHPTAYMNTKIQFAMDSWIAAPNLNTTIERKPWWALFKRHAIEYLIGGD
jgi:hypothetical protein